MVLLILIGLALVLAFCPTIRCAFFHPVKLVRYGVTDLYAYIKYRRWNECKTGELVASKAQLVKGDLVFFGKSGTVDHVGIYVGDGKFVHAPRTGRDVTVSTLETGYWGAKFLQGRRVAGI